MFRNLATFILYIGVLCNVVYIPPTLLMLYTFFIIIGDCYDYYPKKIQLFWHLLIISKLIVLQNIMQNLIKFMVKKILKPENYYKK